MLENLSDGLLILKEQFADHTKQKMKELDRTKYAPIIDPRTKVAGALGLGMKKKLMPR